MNSERTLNELMAEFSVAMQAKADLVSATTQRKLFSLFVCTFVALAAVLLFAATLLWSPVAPVPSAAQSPLLLDGEMAVIYRLEYAETESCTQTTASGCFDATRPSEIEWTQIFTPLARKLHKTLVLLQLKDLVVLQYKSLYKNKYSGLL